MLLLIIVTQLSTQAVFLLSTVAHYVGWPDTEVFLVPLISPYLK